MDKIRSILDGLDNIGKLVPELGKLLGGAPLWIMILLLIGPAVMVLLGVIYLFLPPKEANHHIGYRTYFGMGSVEAWRFTQKLAGFAWSGLGLVLTVMMFLISGGFRGMDMMEMADTAVRCVLWELGLMALCCIVINIVVTIRYDRKGRVRWDKK